MGALAHEMQFKLEKQAIFNDERINYSKYSKFDSVEDFNNQWEILMTQYKKRFSKTQLLMLRIIRQYAVVCPGVCRATFKTLEKAFRAMYGTSIDRSTWRDAVDKAADLGLLCKYDGVRLIKGRGSKTGNVLIFNRADEVRAYAIQRAEEEDAEIARLLEEEYARMTPHLNYAFNARRWEEEKAIKRAEQAEKERRSAQKSAEEERKAKKVSLYVKMQSYIQSKKLNVNVNEFVGIAYGSVKKLMSTINNLSQEQAEEIAYSNFLKAINTKKVKKTHAALYSWLMKDVTNKLNGQDTTMTKAEIVEKQGAKKELLPKFMIDREEDPVKRAALIKDNEYLLAKEAATMQEGREKLPNWFGRHKAEQKAKEQQKALEKAYNAQDNETIDFEKAREEVLKKLEKR